MDHARTRTRRTRTMLCAIAALALVSTVVHALAVVVPLSQPGVQGVPAAQANLSAEALAKAEASALPAEIPLFPLPETSLFPGTSRPFQIYEPRYREMIADALKDHKIIGMVLLRPGFEKDYEGRPPIYGIGCAGVIEKYELLPDGRYLILLRGLTTFRIVGEDQRKPYRLARVEAVAELLKDDERVTLSALRNQIEKLLYAVLPFGAEPPDPSLDDDEFVNIVAQNLDMAESDRQDLLERNSLVARARALVERLERR